MASKKLNFTITLTINAESVQSAEETLKNVLKFAGIREYGLKHEPQKRSLSQNSALHLYFTQVAEEAREKGLTMDLIIKKPQELPITNHLLKDLFRLMGKQMYGKTSTADLTKDELSEVVETFQRIIAERLDITIPFPNEEDFLSGN